MQDATFGPQVGLINTKWEKHGTFSDQISVLFGSVSQNMLISDLKRSPILAQIWHPQSEALTNAVTTGVTVWTDIGLTDWHKVGKNLDFQTLVVGGLIVPTIIYMKNTIFAQNRSNFTSMFHTHTVSRSQLLPLKQ